MVVLSVLLVAAEGIDPYTPLLNFGVLGIVVVLAALGIISFKPFIDHLKAELEFSHAQNEKLIKTYEESVIPALEASAAALKDVNDRLVPAFTAAAAQLKEAGNELRELRDESRRRSP